MSLGLYFVLSLAISVPMTLLSYGFGELALALMRGPQVRDMLEQTRDRIGDAPWGVGLLGFVPHALREEQCAEIWKCPPPFALIAGGRPDQAAEFEKRGITTYIHAPAPALLRMYLEQGMSQEAVNAIAARRVRACRAAIRPASSASVPSYSSRISSPSARMPSMASQVLPIARLPMICFMGG